MIRKNYFFIDFFDLLNKSQIKIISFAFQCGISGIFSSGLDSPESLSGSDSRVP